LCASLTNHNFLSSRNKVCPCSSGPKRNNSETAREKDTLRELEHQAAQNGISSSDLRSRGPLAATARGATGGAAPESLASATPASGLERLRDLPQFPGHLRQHLWGNHALREPCLQIVSEIQEIADQILHLPNHIPDAFRRVRVWFRGQNLARARFRFMWVSEPFAKKKL
jgi:hypothetical protein